MEHSDHFANDGQLLWGNIEPQVEGVNHLAANIFARHRTNVIVWFKEGLQKYAPLNRSN